MKLNVFGSTLWASVGIVSVSSFFFHKCVALRVARLARLGAHRAGIVHHQNNICIRGGHRGVGRRNGVALHGQGDRVVSVLVWHSGAGFRRRNLTGEGRVHLIRQHVQRQ